MNQNLPQYQRVTGGQIVEVGRIAWNVGLGPPKKCHSV